MLVMLTIGGKVPLMQYCTVMMQFNMKIPKNSNKNATSFLLEETEKGKAMFSLSPY